MAEVHYIKNTPHEAVLKCYKNDSNGGIIDIALSDLALDFETFNANNVNVSIQEIYWGAKVGKQIDVTRKDPDSANTHGHYYLVNVGSYDYNGFVDDTYSNWNIRIIGDGAYHVIMKLKKTSGYEV